jgi:hypothetical protein
MELYHFYKAIRVSNTSLMDFSEVIMNEFVIYVHTFWCWGGGGGGNGILYNLVLLQQCSVNCALINVACRKCYDDGDLNAMYLMLKDTENVLKAKEISTETYCNM